MLPVCLGTATKLCDMLTDRTKTYRAVLLLGRDTDTQDTTGETVFADEAGALALDEEGVREAVMGFLGDYDQIDRRSGGDILSDVHRWNGRRL